MLYRVMIVDDEESIASFTAAYLSSRREMDWEVLTAYSAREALEKLHVHPVDVLVSDIQMPGMSGLDLAREVRLLWPLCRVIFLTAHERFSYVHEAVRLNTMDDYVLKAEGVERLYEAVCKAVAWLENSEQDRQLLTSARAQVVLAIPYLQREFMMDLAHGVPYTKDKLAKAQHQLHLPVDVCRPMAIVSILLHLHSEDDTLLDRMERSSVIQLLAQSHMPDDLSFMQVQIDGNRLLWLLQHPSGAVIRLSGLLEGIQRACLMQLKLPISMTYTSECPEYTQIPRLYKRLHAQQASLAVSGVVTWMQCIDKEILPKEQPARDTQIADGWRKAYERGDPNAAAQLKLMLKPLLESSSLDDPSAQECYLLVSAQFCRILKNMILTQEQQRQLQIHLLYAPQAHASSKAAYAYLDRLADAISTLRHENSNHSIHTAIDIVKRHVTEHLGDDLSLTRLSDLVRMNASYLSRIFKQETGQNLAAFIAEVKIDRARQLLSDPEQKILEISEALGFTNPTYFSYFFKKNTGISPGEYRLGRAEKPIQDP